MPMSIILLEDPTEIFAFSLLKAKSLNESLHRYSMALYV
jgi:hypothetical protein